MNNIVVNPVELEMNEREQLTAATYGSNLAATYGFDAYDYPSSTTTGTVQDYRYVFDPATGNLTSRENHLRVKSESFTYDNLDRLLTTTDPQNPTQNLKMTYNANGNLDTKSDIDTTSFRYYTGAGSYALTKVISSSNVIPAFSQTITYNSFGKVSSISEANGSQTIQANFAYNSDNQRARMTVGIYYGAEIMTRYYVGGSYMLEVNPGTNIEYTYLGGDAYTAPVVVKTDRGGTTYYYLLRDYLGNITHLVNSSNTVVAEYSFDAWGRRRNPTDWSYNLAGQPALFADLGFTGHEYLSWFNLYNMNGRLYDPLVGRFLSPDPYVQDPRKSQSYNRYAYCLNNPLKYTDLSGYTCWSHFTNWVGENKEAILTGAYLIGAGVATVFCPPKGLAMFGAYLGGAEANDCQLNPGSWNWKEPATYFGKIIGAGVGYVGGFGLANPGSVKLAISAGILGIGAVGLSLANNNFSFQWTTNAGGGGNYNLNGHNTTPEQIVDISLAKAGANATTGMESALSAAALTIGKKMKFSNTISSSLKWTGRGLGSYNAVSAYQEFLNGEISFPQMATEQISNGVSTFSGIYGASWGIGWELGRGITNLNVYQEWKQNTWLPWRYENLNY